MNRRQWLFKTAIWGLAGTASAALGSIFLDVWLAAGRFSSAHWTPVTSIDSLPEAKLLPMPESRIALVRQDDQVGAVSLECTHLGCLLNTMDEGFYCPCHGSEFGPRGEVYSGPATRSLDWHRVRISGNRLWVHTGEKLDLPHWISTAAKEA